MGRWILLLMKHWEHPALIHQRDKTVWSGWRVLAPTLKMGLDESSIEYSRAQTLMVPRGKVIEKSWILHVMECFKLIFIEV